MAIAGCMGWSQREFLSSSLRYFLASWRGYQHNHREAWERARWMAWIGLTPYAEKGNSIELTDLVIFPWEPQPKPRWVLDEPTLEWLHRFSEEADEFYLQHRAIVDAQNNN